MYTLMVLSHGYLYDHMISTLTGVLTMIGSHFFETDRRKLKFRSARGPKSKPSVTPM